MIALSRDQVRNLDRIAVERFGIPSIVLMENAGRGAAERLLARWPRPRCLIVAGRGNNGGDGFVIARHLALAGLQPRVAVLGELGDFRGPGDAGVNFEVIERMGLPIAAALPADLPPLLADHDLVVDAILGTGVQGEVRGASRAAIEALNAAARDVLAVDLPSGLDCDTGRPLGEAVRARLTVTFAAMKRGLAEPAAREYCGAVEVAGIGCPVVWE